MFRKRDPRGWVYVGLVALGAGLVIFNVVEARDLADWLVTVAVAAVAAGNVLARAFLPPKDPDPQD
jgi:hypothetical protein